MTAAATTVRPTRGPGGHTLAAGSQDNKIRLRAVTGGAVPDVGTGLVESVAGLSEDLRLALRGSGAVRALDLVPR